MVLIKRPERSGGEAPMYSCIDIYFQAPNNTPDENCRVDARPFEFDYNSNTAIKYITVNPHNGNGVEFGPYDPNIHVHFGYNFYYDQPIQIPSSTINVDNNAPPIPAFIDPIINPIEEDVIKKHNKETKPKQVNPDLQKLLDEQSKKDNTKKEPKKQSTNKKTKKETDIGKRDNRPNSKKSTRE